MRQHCLSSLYKEVGKENIDFAEFINFIWMDTILSELLQLERGLVTSVRTFGLIL